MTDRELMQRALDALTFKLDVTQTIIELRERIREIKAQ